MNSQDLYEWKHLPVTEQVFRQLEERVVDYTQAVMELAGTSPTETARLCGAVQAIRDILSIEAEETH